MKHILLIITLLTALNSSAQEQRKILFIGNSLTYYNGMPQTLQKMFDELGQKITVDQLTPSGWDLVHHAVFQSDTFGNITRLPKKVLSKTVKKILSKKWDVVVLQEATLNMLIPEIRVTSSQPAILYLDSIIKYNASRTVLYQGYAGNTNYPLKYCHPAMAGSDFEENGLHEQIWNSINDTAAYNKLIKLFFCSDSFQNSSQEFLSIKCVYDRAANFINAETVPVGFAFELCKIKYPEIPLYQNINDNHPSKQGSYLIACLFYRYIAHKSIMNIRFSSDIDIVEAEKLRKLSNLITFQH